MLRTIRIPLTGQLLRAFRPALSQPVLLGHSIKRSLSLTHDFRQNGIAKDYFRRYMTTYKTSDISTQQYHQASDITMEALLSSLEDVVDKHSNLLYEVEYHSGVLTLNLGDKGTYVINKQPPNKQIWLSSPKSGPKRYDFDVEKNEWFYIRDQVSLRSLLEDELSDAFGETIQVRVEED